MQRLTQLGKECNKVQSLADGIPTCNLQAVQMSAYHYDL